MGPIDFQDSSKGGVDMFSYYSRTVSEFLARDGGEKDNSCNRTGSMLLGDKFTVRFSDVKREGLKSLLRQSVLVLTPQVDEMLEPVMKMHNLQLLLRSNKQQETHRGATYESDIVKCPSKKPRRSSSSARASVAAHESTVRDEPNGEVDDHLQLLLKKDGLKAEAILKKYSDELSAKLDNMRQQLEEVLNTVMSKCRLMTSSEKEILRRQVLKLPEDDLRRASEIIGCREGSETESHHVVSADFKRADNITLWRLYYYVEALEKGGQPRITATNSGDLR